MKRLIHYAGHPNRHLHRRRAQYLPQWTWRFQPRLLICTPHRHGAPSQPTLHLPHPSLLADLSKHLPFAPAQPARALSPLFVVYSPHDLARHPQGLSMAAPHQTTAPTSPAYSACSAVSTPTSSPAPRRSPLPRHRRRRTPAIVITNILIDAFWRHITVNSRRSLLRRSRSRPISIDGSWRTRRRRSLLRTMLFPWEGRYSTSSRQLRSHAQGIERL
jgi:hypothetical protein